MTDVLNGITFNVETHEVEVPAQHETFEAQVLVISKAYKKRESFNATGFLFVDSSLYTLLSHTNRILASGHFTVKLVPSAILNGKPTLVIEEE